MDTVMRLGEVSPPVKAPGLTLETQRSIEIDGYFQKELITTGPNFLVYSLGLS